MDKSQANSVAIGDKDGKALLLLRGTIDIFSADELFQAAESLLERGKDTAVCGQDIKHLDACAIQILVALKNGLREKGKAFEMSDISPQAEEILTLAGLKDYFS